VVVDPTTSHGETKGDDPVRKRIDEERGRPSSEPVPNGLGVRGGVAAGVTSLSRFGFDDDGLRTRGDETVDERVVSETFLTLLANVGVRATSPRSLRTLGERVMEESGGGAGRRRRWLLERPRMRRRRGKVSSAVASAVVTRGSRVDGVLDVLDGARRHRPLALNARREVPLLALGRRSGDRSLLDERLVVLVVVELVSLLLAALLLNW
jgi:hypothetical protein